MDRSGKINVLKLIGDPTCASMTQYKIRRWDARRRLGTIRRDSPFASRKEYICRYQSKSSSSKAFTVLMFVTLGTKTGYVFVHLSQVLLPAIADVDHGLKMPRIVWAHYSNDHDHDRGCTEVNTFMRSHRGTCYAFYSIGSGGFSSQTFHLSNIYVVADRLITQLSSDTFP